MASPTEIGILEVVNVSGRATLIAGVYVVIAGAWIVLSGRMVLGMAGSVEELELLEQYKGIAFVAVSGLGLLGGAYLVLRAQAAEAEKAERARETLLESERKSLAGLFVSSIAHDANNVTMVVSSALNLIDSEEKELSLDSRESLKDALAAMDTLMRLFKDLKEMGRNRSSSTRVVTDLNAAIVRIVTLLRGHSALKHCHVAIVAPAPMVLPVFPSMLDQLLINLLLNAADATGGHGHLEVRLHAVGNETRLEVHDDGKGLPEGMEKSLFKPFATTKPHGTGLGLVCVKECALAHGGRVEYARSPLGGAAFSVCLPARDS